MNIGDLFTRVLADMTGFESTVVKTAEKAGDKAGKAAGVKFGTAMRGGLAVLGAVSGIATKGLLELDQVVADFTSDTGASADEAKRAGEAINAMAGRNMQPMAEIGRALAKVHTDLGLTGDAAAATTERFLKFARVTKRDAASEVAAFDDLLDAWGKTADDAVGIMDVLIASHQKYGGSIADDELALKNLGPAVKALNLSFDDTVGLLNLFKTKGLDASTVQRALNTAIAKLPPGTTFKGYLDALSKIADPAERARKAIDLFGTRGGSALANALGPGIGAIDDYVVTTGEATGAMEKAAEAADSAFGTQVQLKLKAFGSALVAAGKDVGPLLMGLASLTSLAGSLGIDRLIAGGFRKVIGSRVVMAAAAAAGGFAGGIYETAWLRAAYAADAIKAAFGRLAASGPFQSAARALGGKAGGLFRLGFLAAALVVIDVLWERWQDLLNDIKGETAKVTANVATLTVQGSLDDLRKAKAALEKGISDIENSTFYGGPNPVAQGLFAGELADLKTSLADVESQMALKGAEVRDRWYEDVATIPGAVKDQIVPLRNATGDLVDEFGNPIKKVTTAAEHDVEESLTHIIESIRGARQALEDAASGAADAIYDPIIKKAELATTEREIEEQRQIRDSKASTAEQVRDANQRMIELQKTKITLLATLAGYGDTAAQTALQSAIDVLAQTKGLSQDQIAWLQKLQAELDRTRTKTNLLTQSLRYRNGQTYSGGGGKATGGPVTPGETYNVGGEMFVPQVPGILLPASLTQALRRMTTDQAPSYTFNTTIAAQPPARDAIGVVRELARHARFDLFAAETVG